MTESAKATAENQPLYYAERGMVWKRPIEMKNAEGTTVSLGFPICSMHEACAGQEEALAEMLNERDALAARVKELEAGLIVAKEFFDAHMDHFFGIDHDIPRAASASLTISAIDRALSPKEAERGS